MLSRFFNVLSSNRRGNSLLWTTVEIMRKVARNGQEEKRKDVGLMDPWPPGLHSSQPEENMSEFN